MFILRQFFINRKELVASVGFLGVYSAMYYVFVLSGMNGYCSSFAWWALNSSFVQSDITVFNHLNF